MEMINFTLFISWVLIVFSTAGLLFIGWFLLSEWALSSSKRLRNLNCASLDNVLSISDLDEKFYREALRA